MDMILEQYPETILLIDDVMVYGQTKEEQDQNLHKLVRVLRHEGLCFNSAKCAVD